MNWDNMLVRDAMAFAELAHRGQTRKYHGTPYIQHPVAVANRVGAVDGHTPEMLAAALLHDVVEDCGVQQATIVRLFGETVGTYVHWLTDQTTLAMGNRKVRKAMTAARLAHAPTEVHTIKLADLLDNTADIAEHDAKFAPTYLAEVENLLVHHLTHGDDCLWVDVWMQVQAGKRRFA